jgi:hypothetical protein
MTDKLPALTAENISETVEKNLKAMRSAREGFIQAESSERIKRALSHNIRPASEAQFQNGEKVFFKRQDSKRWHGPGTVIGQEGKQVLVKNGGELVRVHASRLIHVHAYEVPVKTSFRSNVRNTKENLSTIIEDVAENDADHTHIEEEHHAVDHENAQDNRNETVPHPDAADIDQEDIQNEDAEAESNETNNEVSKTHPSIKTNILYKLPNSEEWHSFVSVILCVLMVNGMMFFFYMCVVCIIFCNIFDNC